MCMCVCVFTNGVVVEGTVEKRALEIFELFAFALVFSRFRTIKFLLLKKSRIERIAASRVLNQWARKVSRVIRSVVIRRMRAFDTF